MSKLSEIQSKLKAPKSQYNAFGKYKYRNCEDIFEAVKPLLNGATLIISDNMVEVGGRIYVEATALFSDGEEVHKVTAYARESVDKKGMDHAQVTGAASSYARKYALNGLFLIDDTKDADATNEGKPELATTAQIKQINTRVSKLEIDRSAFKKYYGVASMNDVTPTIFKRMDAALTKKEQEKQ